LSTIIWKLSLVEALKGALCNIFVISWLLHNYNT